MGGDILEYQGEVSTKTEGLTTIKLLLNIVISSIWAKFMTADMKNFFLNTPMEEPEYMKIPVRLIPDEIKVKYKVSEFEHAGCIYVKINKGMYGLAQAGLLANELLDKRLANNGFSQTPHTPGLWKHHTKPIQFALVVENVGIKYENKHDAQDLINALERNYEAVSVDWEGELFCGIKLEWDYQNWTVDLSMTGYITKLLQRFSHPTPKKLEHQPHCHVNPQYGIKAQLKKPREKTPSLQPDDIKKTQQIIGAMLYYDRAVDGTLMYTLNELASAQSKGTQATMQATKNMMEYCHTHSDAKVRYCASQMKLHIHSDASYLSASKARSRVGGHFLLSDKLNPTSQTKHNGAILVVSSILKNVIASAAEAELGGLFINSKEGKVLRT